MASQKKVVVRQLDAALRWGYLPASDILDGPGLQLLDTAGRVQPVPLDSVKTICYVHDFNLRDNSDPERIGRRAFQRRPRGEGLWIRLEFADKDVIEGLASFDIAFLDQLVQDRCIGLTLPDAKSNSWRMLVPRTALTGIAVLGLPTSAKRWRPESRAKLQADLFSEV